MKKRFTVIFASALALVGLMLASCIIESERPVIRGPWVRPSGGGPITGWIPIETTGFVGQPISANIWLDDTGTIRYVRLDISSETQSYVGALPGTIIPMILHTNSFNFPNTIVSGATQTALRLTNAAREAFIERGIPEGEVGF